MTARHLLSRIFSRTSFASALLAALATAPFAALAPPAAAQEAPKKPSKFREFADVTKDATKIEGLFDLYHEGQNLYAALKGGDFDKSFLAPMSIARGAASAGMGLNFEEQWVISFKRVGDTVQLIRKNFHYEAPGGTPLQKAVEQNYTDSVLMALPIVSDNAPGGGVLINLSDVFFTDFAELGVGGLDRQRSSWNKIKGFKNNVELQANLTFRGSGGAYGDYGYIDPRGITLVMHYSIVNMPEGGYRQRMADQRVGYFLNATKDFGSASPDTTFVRRINRWRLEKADGGADLSPPKKQIVWWIEDTVPHEYRPFVEQGILEWNKAFEKVGIRNALGVRWQNERDEFDPEDINYCTFRWITTPMTFAMSNVRSNPITGEMIDGDVIFDASWIRVWQQEHSYLVAAPAEDKDDDDGDDEDGDKDDDDDAITLDVGDIISPIMAARYGYGMPISVRNSMPGRSPLARLEGNRTLEVVPGHWSPFHIALSRKASRVGCCAACQYAANMNGQFRMAAMALAAQSAAVAKDGKLPEELVGQAIKAIVMHEVGHSLGLRHNFRASTMLDEDELHDVKITREKGLVGSVMDYMPLNIAPEGETQGDYATTTLGPYDYWAIEYAYKPISGNEGEELKKIAARSPEPGLDYATDEDLYYSNDPRVQVYDLGSNGLAFAKGRITLAKNVLETLDDRLVKDGESWARLQPAFLTALQQFGDAAYLATGYVGGREISRDARGGDGARDPVVPVSGKQQRDALKYLAATFMVDEPIPMRPELLRRVTGEHWMHWGAPSGTNGAPFYAYVQSIQNIALSELFAYGSRMRMIEDNESLAAKGDKPLRSAEVFRTFTDAIWSDLKQARDEAAKPAESDSSESDSSDSDSSDGDSSESDDEDADEEDEDADDKDADEDEEDADEDSAESAVELKLSKVRRNLQRQYLRYLVGITLGPRSLSGGSAFAIFSVGSPFPSEARSLARMHVKEIHGLIKDVLESDNISLDELSRAHLEELSDQLAKTLDARVNAGDF